MNRIDAANVNTFSNCARTLDGDGCIGMDLNNTIWTLLSWCKFALDVTDNDIDIINGFLIILETGAIFTGVVVENVFVSTSVDMTPISQISCRNHHILTECKLTWRGTK